MAGRSKFTEALAKAIVKEAKAGTGIMRAARASGVHPNTLRNWRNQGIASGRGRAGSKFWLNRELDKVEEATVREAEKTLRQCLKHDQHKLNAAKFVLERKLPEEYGRKDTLRVEVDSALRDLLDKCKPLMSTESFGELVDAVAQVHVRGSDARNLH